MFKSFRINRSLDKEVLLVEVLPVGDVKFEGRRVLEKVLVFFCNPLLSESCVRKEFWVSHRITREFFVKSYVDPIAQDLLKKISG